MKMEAIHQQLVVSQKAIYGRTLVVIQTIMNLMIQLKKKKMINNKGAYHNVICPLYQRLFFSDMCE